MTKTQQPNPNDDRFVDDVEWWEQYFDSLEDAYEQTERDKIRRDSELDYNMGSRKPRYRYAR